VLLAVGATLATPLSALRLPHSYLAWPVLLDNDASGFYLHHRDSVYFVTAWHVLFDPKNARLRQSRITLRSYASDESILDPVVFELDLAKLDESHRILSSTADDVAAVRIGDVTNREEDTVRWQGAAGVVARAQPGPLQLVLGSDEWHRFDETKVGNDVFVFAYPTAPGSAQAVEPARPFLRKGALAGKDKSARRLVVDAPASPQGSGGPVIEIEDIGLRLREPKLIGIVVESDDSGYTVVAPMDSILDLIEKRSTPPAPAP